MNGLIYSTRKDVHQSTCDLLVYWTKVGTILPPKDHWQSIHSSKLPKKHWVTVLWKIGRGRLKAKNSALLLYPISTNIEVWPRMGEKIGSPLIITVNYGTKRVQRIFCRQVIKLETVFGTNVCCSPRSCLPDTWTLLSSRSCMRKHLHW